MRKVLCVFLLLSAFCAVSAGGCGGSSSSGGDAGPETWTDLQGTWKPLSEGSSIMFYNSSGTATEGYTVDADASDSVIITISELNELCNVTIGEGTITIKFANVGRAGHGSSTSYDYTYFNAPNGDYSYTSSGSSLKQEELPVAGSVRTKKISYVDENHIKAVITVKEGKTTTMNAEVTFERQ